MPPFGERCTYDDGVEVHEEERDAHECREVEFFLADGEFLDDLGAGNEFD